MSYLHAVMSNLLQSHNMLMNFVVDEQEASCLNNSFTHIIKTMKPNISDQEMLVIVLSQRMYNNIPNALSFQDIHNFQCYIFFSGRLKQNYFLTFSYNNDLAKASALIYLKILIMKAQGNLPKQQRSNNNIPMPDQQNFKSHFCSCFPLT